MKEREFDMLENADDKTVDLLADVPVLTKEEKERMLAMSKKKLDRMNRESNINVNSDEVQVSGVERYNRPKWKTFASMAACLVLIGGIGGTVFAVSRGGKSDRTSTPMAQVTTEATVSDTTTAVIGDGEQEVPYLSDAELLELAKNKLDEFNTVESIMSGFGVKVDKNDSITVMLEDGQDKNTYFRVTDERFSSMADVNAYLGEYLDGDLYKSSKDPYFFKEQDGKLYYMHQGDNVVKMYSFEENDLTIKDYDGTSFKVRMPLDWSGFVRATEIEIGFVRATEIGFVLVDGKWKINLFDVYDETAGLENPADVTADEIAVTLTQLESFRCAPIDLDSTQEKQYHGMTYYKLKDGTGYDFETLRSYVENRATDIALEKYSELYAGYTPAFVELDGEIYSIAGNAGLPAFELSNPVIITQTATTATVKADSNPAYAVAPEKVTIFARFIDGKWKISEYEIEKTSSTDDYDPVEYINYAKKMMADLNELDTIEACGVKSYSDDAVTFPYSKGGEITYQAVEDERFSTIDEVKDFVEARCTGKALEQFSKMYGLSEEYPVFREIDGKLYVLVGGRGSGYDFEEEFDISEVTEDSFKVVVNVRSFGEGTDPMTLRAKKDDGKWKLDSFEYQLGTSAV